MFFFGLPRPVYTFHQTMHHTKCKRTRCHGLSLPMNRVCTGQSSYSQRASAEWQSAVVTPQFNVSFSHVSRVSKHLIEFIAIELTVSRPIVVSAIAVFRLVDNILSIGFFTARQIFHWPIYKIDSSVNSNRDTGLLCLSVAQSSSKMIGIGICHSHNFIKGLFIIARSQCIVLNARLRIQLSIAM